MRRGRATLATRRAWRYVPPVLDRQPSPAENEAAADEASDDQAMAEYVAKGGISHEAMRTWILSWGAQAELHRPKIGD